MWETVQTNQRHLSHDLPCPRCGHAVHTYLACSDTCDCVRTRHAGRRRSSRLTVVREAAIPFRILCAHRVFGSKPMSVVAASVWGMTTTPGLDAGDFRTPVPLRRNRLHWFAGRTHEVLDEIGQPATWAMTPHEHGETIAELLALRSRIDAHLFAVLADADRADVAARPAPPAPQPGCAPGPGSPAPRPPAWSAKPEPSNPTRRPTPPWPRARSTPNRPPPSWPPSTHSPPRWPTTPRGRDPPAGAGGTARRPRPARPRPASARSGRPRPADALIARHLEREETQAHKTCFLKTWSDGHGSTYGRFKIPDLTGTFLTTALEAYANPNRPDPIPRKAWRRPRSTAKRSASSSNTYPPTGSPNRRHQRHRARHHDPRHPARRATGREHPGHRHPALPRPGPPPGRRSRRHPRRPRQPIPTPRPRPTTHLHPTPTIAMALRQGGVCNIKRCERPATWCDANHRQPWSQGGHTTIDNGELICPRHHTLVHQGHHYPRRT